MRVYLLFLTLFFCSISFAQNTISGSVTDSNNQPIPGANIKVSGESAGAITDFDGSFVLRSAKKLPILIEITALGYSSKRMNVSSANQKVVIKLSDEETKLNEIVVSASRTPERVLESPVTIERMGIAEIKKTASATFYEGLENLKEVQMNTSSLTFKSINTRGFASVANTRFMQLVDGMDNSSPLLNFVIGNMIGVSEIDVQSVELLPGASSALYGANAFNGILFMNSKSPFTSEGVRAYAKFGQTSQKAAGVNDYVDYGIRMAKAFNPYFAAKANLTFMRGTDWFATNNNGINANGDQVLGIDRTNPNYNGINVYGDDFPLNLGAIGNVTRTGYNETDLTDNKASNSKIDFSLHLRPFGNENFEVIWQSKFGFGNAVYQGANRYYLNNFFMEQHKLEFKGKNFFLRGYTTTEDGGNSYDMLFTGININRKWKSDEQWGKEYANAYGGSMLAGMTSDNAHKAARTAADTGRFLPGTPEFKNAFNQVINDPSVLSGSKLVDNSRIYHSDVNYNFKDLIKFAEIQIGGSYREFRLNSFGRIYTDANGPIKYNEYGAYTQVTKKLLDDRLKFTGSLRYDKAQNFKENYSPRVSLVYSAGASKKHNFRASFQTGFKNPTTQDQYIGFDVGNAILLGSAPDNLSRFTETRKISLAGQQPFLGVGATRLIDGNIAYNNSYTAASVGAFSATGNSTLLRKTNMSYVKPEEVKAFELGYRSVIKDFSVDINGYYNIYNNFIGNVNVVAPLYGTAQDSPIMPSPTTLGDKGAQSVYALSNKDFRVFQLYNNSLVEIKSLGFGLGLSKKVYKDFEVGVNYNYAQFDFDKEKDPSFEAGFNTPKHRVKASFGNEKLFTNFGFNVSGRWNSEYMWESTMVDGIIESATVIDAQINYLVPRLNSTFKVGAANIGAKEYTQVLGAGAIGQQIFASWTLNP